MLTDATIDLYLPQALMARGLACSAGADGMAVDLVEAHVWFNLAAHGGAPEAADYRAEVADEMSRSQINEAQRRARALLRDHGLLASPRGAC